MWSDGRPGRDGDGTGASCLIVGEVAQAHDGSLGMAHAFIDAIAAAGANAVKFQTHLAAAESTPREPWRVRFCKQDESRYAYWKRMEFTEAQWRGLKQHADDRGLLFLSSPFSLEAADLLERIGVAAWKVASGEVNNGPLLRRLTRSRMPVMVSSGMSPLPEIDACRRHAEIGGRARLRAAVHVHVSLRPGAGRPEHDPVLSGSLWLRRRPVGSLGHDLSGSRGGHARYRRARSPRHAEPRDVRS